MTIGEKIRYYRETLGITQDDLAEALKTTPQNIYKYERGIITNIPLTSIEALADLFKLHVTEFVGWNNNSMIFDENDPDIHKKAAALGANIKLRRLELGINEITFAKKLGVVLEKVRNYENGKFRNMDKKQLDAISEVLETTVATLLDSIEIPEVFELTDVEKQLIMAYREHPEYHAMIYKALNYTPVQKPQPENGRFKYPTLTSDEISRMQPRAKIASPRAKYGAAPGENPYENVAELPKKDD